MKSTPSIKDLLKPGSIAKFAGAHNALGAQLVARTGFDGIWASGLELCSSLGIPDAGILSIDDMLYAVQGMTAAATIPVLVDCDTGFGPTENLPQVVNRFERAGATGICIEDKSFPKLNSFVDGLQSLETTADFAQKIIVAKSAQQNPDFMIVARVEAFIAGCSVREALQRARAYTEAGADAILIHSKLDHPGEIQSFMEQWDMSKPVLAVPTTYHKVHAGELQAMNFAGVIYANHGLRAAISATESILRKIMHDGSTHDAESLICSLEDVFELQGMKNHLQQDQLHDEKSTGE